jgi:hypothetical protein
MDGSLRPRAVYTIPKKLRFLTKKFLRNEMKIT